MGAYKLGDYLNDIYSNKVNLFRSEPESKKGISIFILNRMNSLHADVIHIASELNQMRHVTDDMKYDFMVHGIRRARRFARMPKIAKSGDVTILQEHYNISEREAREIYEILTTKEISEIREGYDTGGAFKRKSK